VDRECTSWCLAYYVSGKDDDSQSVGCYRMDHLHFEIMDMVGEEDEDLICNECRAKEDHGE